MHTDCFHYYIFGKIHLSIKYGKADLRDGDSEIRSITDKIVNNKME